MIGSELRASARDALGAVNHAREAIDVLQDDLRVEGFPEPVYAELDWLARALTRTKPLVNVVDAVAWADGLRSDR